MRRGDGDDRGGDYEDADDDEDDGADDGFIAVNPAACGKPRHRASAAAQREGGLLV